ncbi:CMD multi-domain protein [Purpureocillium lavendulum]|uniref:CMD multi-domain protein n=1 Tax=Purpureocillium lavendulum TaxID=1247861 RepID=A0AB34FT26_9HYPO|nr:CMD multi-domain protein [Purpureocillium lavendulum]
MSTNPKLDELHRQLFEEGLKMRRSVVGDTYVDRALANGSTEFSRPGQELVTEWCWGYAWTRPGLEKKQRSLLNIGMLMALNRTPELAVHVRGARNNGLTETEIREAILHCTTYCGVPAGVEAMKTAEKVLDEMAEKGEMQRELGAKSEGNVHHPEANSSEALSVAAEEAGFHDAFAVGSADDMNNAERTDTTVEPMSCEDALPGRSSPFTASVINSGLFPDTDLAGMDYSTFDDFSHFLDTAPLPSFHFTSMVTTEQPLPFFSPPNSENDAALAHSGMAIEEGEHPDSFSRLGSRLPSLQPDEVTSGQGNDRELLLEAISVFETVASDFRLPTRLTLSRYIRGYVDGFHEHLPFLHIPSMTVASCAVELVLAMAAVGAQYCFEAEEGLGLFHAARAIATERIRRRDARLAAAERIREQDAVTPSQGASNAPETRITQAHSAPRYTCNGPLGLPSDTHSPPHAASPIDDLMQSAQALLLLMAMATWAKHKEILREALAIQSILASIIRDDGLREPSGHPPSDTWEQWARSESVLRTKYIVFCFFNLHCIVYDIPPLILNSELNMQPFQFQHSLRRLFSFDGGAEVAQVHSALGSYVLIHAIIQHIFFVRQSARCRFESPDLTLDEVKPLEQAVRNWQSSWKHSPESSLNPMDPNGPVAFNSTALLRLAYIRLNMDTGPGRALSTRDPQQIAHALRATPPIKRSPKLIRALLHSSHALSIPIKIGIRLVARTQTFIWSIQHSLCSLECALLLGKWLETISALGPEPDPPISDGETPDAMKMLMVVLATSVLLGGVYAGRGPKVARPFVFKEFADRDEAEEWVVTHVSTLIKGSCAPMPDHENNPEAKDACAYRAYVLQKKKPDGFWGYTSKLSTVDCDNIYEVYEFNKGTMSLTRNDVSIDARLRFGFIGLGVMGWGMANNLRAKIPAAAALSVSVAATAKGVIEQSDVVITMLPAGPAVASVFMDPKTGLLAADPSHIRNKIFLDCSTIDAATSLRVAAEVQRLRGWFVDAPVSGGVHGATTGTLSIMVGCDSTELFQRIKPVLSLMGQPEKIFHCGGASAGLVTKQINNYLSCVTMLGTCEAMTLGQLSGLDPVKLAEVIKVSTGACYNCGDQNPVRGVSSLSSASRDFEGGFTTEMAKGVLDMAVDHGSQVGAKLVLGGVLSEFYAHAAEHPKCRGKDFRSIFKLFSENDGRDLYTP